MPQCQLTAIEPKLRNYIKGLQGQATYVHLVKAVLKLKVHNHAPQRCGALSGR